MVTLVGMGRKGTEMQVSRRESRTVLSEEVVAEEGSASGVNMGQVSLRTTDANISDSGKSSRLFTEKAGGGSGAAEGAECVSFTGCAKEGGRCERDHKEARPSGS